MKTSLIVCFVLFILSRTTKAKAINSTETFCNDPKPAQQNTFKYKIEFPSTSRPSDNHFPIDSVITYECVYPFALKGQDKRTCKSDGQWDGKEPKCEYDKPYCDGKSAQIVNGRTMFLYSVGNKENFPENSYPVGTSVRYSCLKETEKPSPDEQLTCTESGKWNGTAPNCTQSDDHTASKKQEGNTFCAEPKIQPSGAKVSYSWTGPADAPKLPESSHHVGTNISYECISPLQRKGSSFITCQSDGQWSGQPPTCIREETTAKNTVKCPKPGEDFYFGTIRIMYSIDDKANDGYPTGSTLNYECNDQYVLEGNAQRKCLNNGQWDGTTPKCVKK